MPTSGTNIGLSSRYIQYRASLATSDPAVTPALLDVEFRCDYAVQTSPSTWGALKRRYR